MNKTLVFIAVYAVAFLYPVFSSAAILDQANESDRAAGVFVFDMQAKAQTFTVGVAGTLDSIELVLYRDVSAAGSFMVSILDSNGSFPEYGAGPLFQQSYLITDVVSTDIFSTLWTRFDVSRANIQVGAGDILAIAVSRNLPNDSGNSLVWRHDWPNPYVAGDDFTSSAGTESGWFPSNNTESTDLLFRTYVEPSSVPLPAGAWLFVSALASLIGFRTRRT